MPPKPPDVLDQARSLIERRLKELDDERKRLEGTLSDITGGRVGRRRPGRPRGSTTTRRATGRRRGRRRSTRADQAVKHVQANPGQGKVRKKGKGYVAA